MSMRRPILDAIARVESKFAFKFVPAGETKPKVIPGAIQRYANDCQASQVVAIMDTTLLSSGKEGFLLTETHFYNSYSPELPIPLDQMAHVEASGKDHLSFTLRDGKPEKRYATIYAPYVAQVLQTALDLAQSWDAAAGSLEDAVARALAGGKAEPAKASPAAQSAQALVDTGKREQEAKRYDAAREAFRKAAEQGSAEGAYHLGRMCHEGQGADKDDAQAVEWYRKAAEQGYAPAQNALGRMYDKGWGVSRNYSDALHWYRKAAESGLAVAQFNVGNMYLTGDGVPQDYSKAREWYEKAAAQGNAKAQYGLGLIYEKGRGVKKDSEEAVKWYRLAAEKGHEKAKEALARMEKKDEAPEKKESEALSSLQEAIARQLARQAGSTGAAEEPKKPEETPPPEPAKRPEAEEVPGADPEAVQLISEGLKEYRTGNYGSASRAFQKAGTLGHPYAWFNLAVMYEKGRGVSRNLSTAFRWYLKAAEAGIVAAQFNVGQMYYLGEGVDADRDKAFTWYLKAAEAGVAEAQAMVGAIWQDRKDPQQARVWLQKAADQGLEAARDALEKL